MRHHNKALSALFAKLLGNPTVFAIFRVPTLFSFKFPTFSTSKLEHNTSLVHLMSPDIKKKQPYLHHKLKITKSRHITLIVTIKKSAALKMQDTPKSNLRIALKKAVFALGFKKPFVITF